MLSKLLIRPHRPGRWPQVRRTLVPRSRLGRAAAIATAAALLVGTLPAGPAIPAAAAAAGPGPARPLGMAATKPVPVHPVAAHPADIAAMPTAPAPKVTWPAAGTTTVGLTGATAARAGSLPVWISPATDGAQGTQTAAAALTSAAAATPSRVTVTMAPHQTAEKAGSTGVVFTLARADGSAAAGSVHVQLSYAGFAGAYGGDYAARLTLVRLPACALTTPQRPGCLTETPLTATNDTAKQQLAADVALPPGTDAAAPAVLAATASPTGSAGDFTATPLSEAGTWSAGDSAGVFAYSYPIDVPSVPGGLAPSVSLAYDSQAVDGLTSSTNNQASWIGDGWDYSPGFIERDYRSCQQNPAGATKTGDLCWSSDDTVTMSFQGQNTTLVQDGTTGAWHPEADDGERVQYKTGTTNGTHDGGYWVITTTDGTQFYFGLNQLPGYTGKDASTNSAWTAPVFATASGQPCYNATFADAYCDQAWRWNLDYVVDPHGDAIAYYYDTETNYYARDKNSTANASYTQAGALQKIAYGFRAGTAYSATPAAQVLFDTAALRTDLPSDLACKSGASCLVQSPTFWGRYELTSITTQALKGSTLTNVDSWSLAHSYPSTNDPGSPASLWLASVTRTGEDGGSVALPPETFSGLALANRVQDAANLGDGYSIITRFRLQKIVNETGGVITVGYSSPSSACLAGDFPAPDDNTGLCYPDYWTPSGATPVLDWFNKYVVTSVTQQDTTGGGVPVTDAYLYTGGAWHYDDDTLTRSQNRTWDQWRGFRTVTTEVGSAPDPVMKTTDTYFQGMDGDYRSGGGTSSVQLTDSTGGTVTDAPALAGKDFENVVYDGTGGGEVSDTVTDPWISAATATQAQPAPLPTLKSYLVGEAATRAYTPGLASGGTRESEITYTHDAYGRVTQESSVPDTAQAAEDTCTTTTYLTDTGAWILNLVAEATVVSVPCGSTVALPQDAVSDTQIYYDGATSLTATPTAGDVTMTRQATSYSGSTPVYTTESTATHDEYGRTLASTDADGRTTTTSYTPATGAEPGSTTVTDPAGLVTTTVYDQLRDQPLTTTAPDGLVTAEGYDALGQLAAVWKPGHRQGTDNPDLKFAYDVSNSAPSVVTTYSLNNTGGYTVSEVLYDSLGRSTETQDATPDGGRDITDTVYDSAGRRKLVSNAYYTSGAPSGTLVAATDGQVPSQTGYVYDGDGRSVRQISYSFATETWETDTTYGGDYTTVVPPSGGTAQTTFTDGRGLTTELYQYHAGAPADPGDPPADYDATGYTSTPAKQLATVTDAAGDTWSYGYDLSGNQISQTDPDTGTSTSAFDAAGQQISTTDARGDQVGYAYDADGRKVGEYDTTGGAAQSQADETASWTYDTMAKGQLTSSTSYVGGNAYTTEMTGYNAEGLARGTETVIPPAAGALAGTYETTYAYDPYTFAMSSYSDGAAGGLPAETVDLGYDSAGNPDSVGSTLGDYVASLSYTEFDLPLEYTFGTTTEPAWLQLSYDQQTQRLTEALTETGTVPVAVDDTHYTYTPDGQVTSEADTPDGSTTDVQCFQYDYLDRLVQAWAQGTSTCASTPSQSTEGGTTPYWESYSYNMIGDLTAETSTATGGAATTTADSYPTGGSPQPHAVQAQTQTDPDGSQTTQFGYDAAGDTTSIAAPGRSQTLTWTNDGKLGSVTTSAASTTSTASYIYDAAGDQLLTSDPSTATLYLPDEQLVLDKASGTVTGTRYYSVGSTVAAARTSAGQVSYLIPNRQGTDLLSVDASTLAVTQRRYDPYGQPLGAQPSDWPGDKGFVGGTTDPATGLTGLGAREYDPATGLFISPDPVLEPTDPQDFDPYAYAGDDPTTEEDPSGEIFGPGCALGPCPGNSGGWGSVTSGGGSSKTYDPYAPIYDPLWPIYGGTFLGGRGGVFVPPYIPPMLKKLPIQKTANPADQPVCSPTLSKVTGCAPDVKATPVSCGWCQFIAKHWRGIAQLAGLGICAFLSAGLCFAGGVLYSIADYVTESAKDGGWVGNLPKLAWGIGTAFATAYGAKIAVSLAKPGEWFADSGKEPFEGLKNGYSLVKDWWNTPVMRADKGEGPVLVGRTAAVMGFNGAYGATGCLLALACLYAK